MVFLKQFVLTLLIALLAFAQTLQRTIWRPDTCGCALIYTWDSSVPLASRVHTPAEQFTKADGTVIKAERCAIHAALLNTTTHHVTVGNENSLKNNTFTQLEKSLPTLLDPVTGNLRSGVAIFSWDQNRKLIITLNGLTAPQKSAVQTAVDTAVGSGKVTIQ